MHHSRMFSVVFLVCMACSFAAAQTYTVTDLGSLDLNGVIDVSYATGINSQGQVVGNSYTSSLLQHAYFWSQGSGMLDLGTFGGPTSFAYGINDAGQVVGNADLSNGMTHAFVWTQALGKQDIGTKMKFSTYAFAINNAGQVVGEYFPTSITTHAFLWTKNAGFKDLGTLGGSSSVAYAVNDLGQVVGQSANAAGEARAFLWTEKYGMQDLGTFKPFDGSTALGINHSGTIVGYSGETQLFQYTYGIEWTRPTGAKVLPFIAGSIQNFPMAIDDAGNVVGQLNDSQGNATAMYYSASTGIVNLNNEISSSSGWFLATATAINKNGQIAGSGVVQANGLTPNHAFVLTKAQ